ncbi:hypothetical protein ACOSP7_032488 [Xanthoceras sorbifolium]
MLDLNPSCFCKACGYPCLTLRYMCNECNVHVHVHGVIRLGVPYAQGRLIAFCGPG